MYYQLLPLQLLPTKCKHNSFRYVPKNLVFNFTLMRENHVFHCLVQIFFYFIKFFHLWTICIGMSIITNTYYSKHKKKWLICRQYYILYERKVCTVWVLFCPFLSHTRNVFSIFTKVFFFVAGMMLCLLFYVCWCVLCSVWQSTIFVDSAGIFPRICRSY